MASNFPSSPVLNQSYTADSKTWTWNGSAWALGPGVSAAVTLTDVTVLNDISNEFDGQKTVFNLRLDQDLVTSLVDSKELDVFIGGQKLNPYVDTLTYPWLSPYDSFKGFRVRSGTVTIYNAPYAGDSASISYARASTSRQKRKYPFSASTIAFGD